MREYKEIEIAIKAAQTAGRYLKEEKKNLNLKINSNPRDTKLIADVKSEKLILDILNSESSYPVLAEETGKTSDDLGDIFWVVDPLDGTANYNRNIPICCVSIGLVKKRNQFPSNITNDCLKVPSTNSPNINPIITGTTEKP